MTQPYPIPRQTRQSAIFLGDGGKVYSGFNFQIFDIKDVEVWTMPAGAVQFTLQPTVTVAKVADAPLDDFTITFSANQALTTEIVVRSARLDERSTGVVSGTRIDPDALEKEFSKISTEMQELRRDVDRGWKSDFGQDPLTLDTNVVDGDTLMKSGNRLVKGPNASDIANAQDYAESAAEDADAAAASAAAAAASAASINIPPPTLADAGKTLFINPAGNGYVTDVIKASRVTPTATDELRITIGKLAYPARYGTYDPTGVADSTAALQAAVNSKKYVEVGEGVFKTTATIALASGSKLIGYGRGVTKINIASTTLAAISLASAGIEMDIKDLSVIRTGTPVAGAHGIVCLDAASLCKLNNLYVAGHWNGLQLRSTGYSEASDIIVTNNLSNGIYMQNTTGVNSVQWYLARVLAQLNVGHGVFAEGLNGGGTQVALGDWNDIRSFANSGAGVAVKGYVGAEVNALRLRGGFLGEDGVACIFLDSRGFGHKIENMFLEIAGTRTTGPALTTPATGNAPGIQIQSAEQDVKVADCYISGNTFDGINSNVAILLRVDSTTFRGNTGYGVAVADGSKYAETGCDFIGNTVGTRSFTAGAQSATILGATPAATSPTQIQGGVAVGVPSAGGTPTAGLINVAGGLLKNNVGYSNP